MGIGISEQSKNSVRITDKNPALADLKLSWQTPAFTAEDGIGPLASLYQAGDAFVAVVRLNDEGATVLGSGVMVAPGLLVTATHVIEEFQQASSSPVFMTFLSCGARAWLPHDWAALSKQSEFYEDRRVNSDVALFSCTLNSNAFASEPLMLAPMQIALPLIGERLWAIGFRHQAVKDGAALVTPLISSGLVTEAYPNGRGERMPSPCFEIGMETVGGMSGGAIVNADGRVVGILSSSIEGGPSYVTLLWEALRLRVKGTIPKLQENETVTLLGAHHLNLAKLKGDVQRDPWGDTTIRLSKGESDLLMKAAGIETTSSGWSKQKHEDFSDKWGSELEDIGSEAAIAALKKIPVRRLSEFLKIENIPDHCLRPTVGFSVEDFNGVEDFELKSATPREDGMVAIEYFFRIDAMIWTIEVPAAEFAKHASDYEQHFLNIEEDGPNMKMEIIQRPYIKVATVFNPKTEELSDATVIEVANYPKKQRPR